MNSGFIDKVQQKSMQNLISFFIRYAKIVNNSQHISLRKVIFTAERTVHRRVEVSKVTMTTLMNNKVTFGILALSFLAFSA